MRTLAPLAVLLATVTLVQPTMAQANRDTAVQTNRDNAAQAVLSPGDSVRIAVWRKPELSGDYVISQDGTVSHPLFRAVKVGGIPFQQAQENLRTFLSTLEENPQFVMEPLIRVAVSGEVTRPQVFAVAPQTTIGEAVARAGGTTQFGARSHVRLLRFDGGQQRQYSIDLGDPVAGGATMPVHSGDQIVVDRKKSFMRDIILPTLGVIGSVASIALLIDRTTRGR